MQNVSKQIGFDAQFNYILVSGQQPIPEIIVSRDGSVSNSLENADWLVSPTDIDDLLIQNHHNSNDINNPKNECLSSKHNKLVNNLLSCTPIDLSMKSDKGIMEDETQSSVKSMLQDRDTSEGSNDDVTVIKAGDNVSDEPYTYLQGLNSQNLMQFSQQSALQEMMLNFVKPKNDTLPKLIDHDYGGYNFHMVLLQPKRTPWFHSAPLNKIYIKMNQTFNIDVAFSPKMPIQQLRLRVFLCFVKEVSEPIIRCQNHMIKDNDQNKLIMQSSLRCHNPGVEYWGEPEGKIIGERTSIVLPLSMSTAKDDKTICQTLAFTFTCQNSCFGRRETAMVFCMENANGEIMGQRVLEVKICSCPKRDKEMEERSYLEKQLKSKRKLEDDENGNINTSKKHKVDNLPYSLKEETTNQSNHDPSGSSNSYDGDDDDDGAGYEIKRTKNGRYRLVVTIHDKEHLLNQLDGLHDKAAGAMLRDSKNTRQHQKFTQKMLMLKERVQKMQNKGKH